MIELESYRVWPDGTVQDVMEGAPYSWMSDDYCIVDALDEEAALVAYSKLYEGEIK